MWIYVLHHKQNTNRQGRRERAFYSILCLLGPLFACGKATPMEISSEQELRGLQLDERENLISPVGAKEWPSDVDSVAS